jgi:hypothetical protein
MNLIGPYYFYNKSVVIWFDPDAHKYLREIGEEKVEIDGVTTTIKIIDKSPVLIPWASKKVIERVLQLMPFEEIPFETDKITKSISETEFKRLLNRAKFIPKEILDDAGNIGSISHKCLEDSINHALQENAGRVEYTINNPTDVRAISCVNAAFDWMKKHNVRWVSTERKVYSLTHDYCGTLDGLAMVDSCSDKKCCKTPTKDVFSLIDWKTSNGIWVDYLYQTAAYENAFEEETEECITDRWILRLGKQDGQFEPMHIGLEEFDLHFKGFLDCLSLTRTHKTVTASAKSTKRKK